MKPREKNQELKRLLIFKYGTLLESARNIGVSYDRLTSLISGRSRPSIEEQIRLSQMVDVPKEILFPQRDVNGV